MTENRRPGMRGNRAGNILWVGCGALGLKATARLRDAGYQVTATRRSEAGLAALPRGVDGLVLEVGAAAAQPALVEQRWEAVIVTLSAPANAGDYWRVYVEGMLALVAELEKNPHRPLLLFASSTSVYAQNDGSEVDETSPAAPVGYSGRTMLAAEAVLANSALAGSAIRFSGIYGAGRRNHLLEVLRQGRICPPQPAHYSNRIHSIDCARVFEHLLARAGRGEALADIYLGCDGNSAPLREIMLWLAEREHIAVDQLCADYLPGRGGNRRCRPARLQAEGFVPQYASFREGFAAG
ncbi:MAG: NAD-dependent epimerase/dehydratase family protein [Pseudomonadales bacterium]